MDVVVQMLLICGFRAIRASCGSGALTSGLFISVFLISGASLTNNLLAICSTVRRASVVFSSPEVHIMVSMSNFDCIQDCWLSNAF